MKYIITISILFLFFSCAEKIDFSQCVQPEIYGFWYGLLHGFIAPFAFIVSLFKEEVTIYAINNNGVWYNLGFLLGFSILTSGGSTAAKKGKKC